MRVLFLGDVVGRPGREAVLHYLSGAAGRYDLIVVNGENAAGGFGITPEIASELFNAGVHIITSGNHIWKKSTIIPMLDSADSRILRPANYPPGNPGRGSRNLQVGELSVQVINLQGRVFTDFTGECPFRIADRIIESGRADIRLIDFHAEATSEKMALARFLDGRVNLLAGTHTHVQTADEQVLPGGTAYLTDLGMCGSCRGVIGMETSSSIARFTSGRYSRLRVAQGGRMVNGLDITFDGGGKITELRRVYEFVETAQTEA